MLHARRRGPVAAVAARPGALLLLPRPVESRRTRPGRGNNWVILAVIVRLPGISRPAGIPVMAKLVIKGSNSKSRLWLARRMIEKLAGPLPGRAVRAVADSAYAGAELKELPAGISWTTRLRKDAALHGLPPARTGKPGRLRVRGKRLPPLAGLAATAEFSQVTVIRYQKTETIQAAMITCLWYSVFGSRPVRVVLIRDKSKAGCDLALVTTDRDATMIQVIERYASRWSIEVAIQDSKQLFGTGHARNRTARAVERTVPFEIACQAVAVTWYATADRTTADLQERRRNSPWYTSKAEPSTSDMTALLRRVLIAARFKAPRPDQPTREELHAIRLAWEDAVA
jgi:hypothetical protein